MAHHRNQGLPQSRVHVYDGVLLTNLPVEPNGRRTPNMQIVAWQEKLSKYIKPRISVSTKRGWHAEISLGLTSNTWSLIWIREIHRWFRWSQLIHAGKTWIKPRAWRLPIDMFGDLVFPSSWLPASLQKNSLLRSQNDQKTHLSENAKKRRSENVLAANLFNLFASCKLCMTFMIWVCPKTRATSRMVSLLTRSTFCVPPHVWAISIVHSLHPIMASHWAEKIERHSNNCATFPSWVSW